MNSRFIVAVVLLAVLATVFGVFGSVAPPLAEETVAPRQELPSGSSSVAHFAYPPSFDSGWVEITKCGENYDIAHNLNTSEVLVDITGKQTTGGGEHKRNFGITNYPGWSYSYSNPNGIDEVESIELMSDGGYAWAGYVPESWSSAVSNFRLVVTSSDGDKRLDKMFGGSGEDKAYSLEQTSDGGYVLAGYTSSYGAGILDFWLVKTDSSGTLQWNKTFGGAGIERAYCVVQTTDGGYAMAGSTNSFTTSYEFWLVKTDSAGAVQWNATYGGAGDEGAYSMIQTSDGGYLLVGYTYSFGAGNADSWLVKTDSSGVMQWNKTYGGIDNDEAYSIIQTRDGGYASAGHSSSDLPATNYWLVKTDSSGTMQWNKTYGSGDARSLIEAAEGGYVLAGNGFASLVKTDSDGNQRWAKVLKGVSSRCVVEAGVGRYVVGGSSGGDSVLVTPNIESGLDLIDSTSNTISLYRGSTDAYWNYVRVRVWTIKEPTWQYGDINQDGTVDTKDLYILGKNYGKTVSTLSFGSLVAVAGIHFYKKKKQRE